MSNWLLPPGSPGSVDEWCFHSATASEIRVHTSYSEYYSRLANLFAQTSKGDEIFLVGWGFGLEEMIQGNRSALFFLEAARGRGARVRIVSTPSHSWNKNQSQMTDATAKKIDAVIDRQLPTGSLHHQKAVYMKVGENSHLFVGGMDVTTDRVDQFFDVQAEIIGAGAELGRKSLEERWESIHPPLGGMLSTAKLIPLLGKSTSHTVQFVRTYPPFPIDTTNWKRTFATAGDHTYYQLVSRAITNAKKSIYIEDQFLWPMGKAPERPHAASGLTLKQRSDVPDLPDSLENMLANAIGRGVEVVVIGPNENRYTPTKEHRPKVTRMLKNAKTQPLLLQVQKDMLFVHSKVWIFDDELVLIGSGNFWHKSFVNVSGPAEAELGVAIESKVDGTALQFKGVSFGRALRIRLWEHILQRLDNSYVFPRDPAASFKDEAAELQKPIGGLMPFLPM